MSMDALTFALRSSKGIKLCYGPPQSGPCEAFPVVANPNCRDLSFSSDGGLFSWCANQGASVVECKNFGTMSLINQPGIAYVKFSPKGTYLSTWAPYKVKESQQASCNLHIYDVKTGECIKSFIQKKQTGWYPQWSDDEKICARNVNNDVHFFEDADFSTIKRKISMQKVANLALAPGPAPYHIACFVPGVKGQPSFVRMFKYPNFEGSGAIIAQRSFFKAERTDFYWNKTGKDCIFLTSVDVDKSGMSYYGELNLYYASVKGETAKIVLAKSGPVYSVQWSPDSTQFCVVYGFMPAKATVFNLKCEPVLDFDGAPRNEVTYSPLKKQISNFKSQDSTVIQWSYDGEYILTATTSPRLRIGNGYRIWHYTGSLLVEVFLPSNEELYDIKWKPVPEGTYTVKPTTFTPVAGIKSALPEASKQVYRPPGAQGKQSTFKLHDEESKKEETGTPNALTKYQRKRLARKARKEQEKSAENTETSEKSEPVEMTYTAELTGDPEKDKKIRNIVKKLNQIDKLKQDQAAGKPLQPSQVSNSCFHC
ncbi:eukaryotic translation initiation factor 2A [Trichonephila clavata]|uniref:Eukaryotic translation initiation factor 2A n=1 Tax=Trichonephila clavata TaxID=2740835 RepID=A0A8X6GDW3_TRICU|nr:eukaryotic translation initiation factor 2A [Trichonephila clavata]